MMTESAAIEARNLTKRFGDVLAVDAVDFDVRPGAVFGFLGPNGAGKTSTINMPAQAAAVQFALAELAAPADEAQSKRRISRGSTRQVA